MTESPTPEALLLYCLQKQGAYLDRPFGPQPECAKAAGKIFAELYTGPDNFKITLKCDPMRADFYRSRYPGVVERGYYCPPSQQPHRNTVWVEKIDPAVLFEMIDHSYERVTAGLTKKAREELKTCGGFRQDRLYRHLQLVRKRPGMFLGEKSIVLLSAYCDGYLACERDREPGCRCHWLEAFLPYLQSKYKVFSYYGCTGIVRLQCEDDGEALDAFYTELDAFTLAAARYPSDEEAFHDFAQIAEEAFRAEFERRERETDGTYTDCPPDSAGL